MKWTKKQIAACLITCSSLTILGLAAYLLYSGKNSGKEADFDNMIVETPDATVDDVWESKSDMYGKGGSADGDDQWGQEDSTKADGVLEVKIPDTSGDLDTFLEEAKREKEDRTIEEGVPAPVSDAVSESEAAKAREEELRRRLQIYKEEGFVTDDKNKKDKEPAEKPVEEPKEKHIDISANRQTPTSARGIIQSFDEEGGDNVTADRKTKPEQYPYKCMLVREEKIRSGQRVTIRLMEDITVGNIVIPKNMHLMATASIDDRLMLRVGAVEMYGRIYDLHFDAYDSDGSMGLYCPDLHKQVKNSIRQGGNSLISSIIGRRVSGVAGEIVNSTISTVQTAQQNAAVVTPAGYTFFLVYNPENR